MRQKGGRNSARRLRHAKKLRVAVPSEIPHGGLPTTLDEAAEIASWCVRAVATGAIDPRTAAAVGTACSTFRAIVRDRDISAAALAKLKGELVAELRGERGS